MSNTLIAEGQGDKFDFIQVRTPDVPNTELGVLSGFYLDLVSAIQAIAKNTDTFSEAVDLIFDNMDTRTIVDSSPTNAAQQYIRFGDGLQICWLGDWISGNQVDIDLPVPFINDSYIPVVNVVYAGEQGNLACSIVSKTKTTFTIKLIGIPDFQYSVTPVVSKGIFDDQEIEVEGSVTIPTPVWPTEPWGYQALIVGRWK